MQEIVTDCKRRLNEEEVNSLNNDDLVCTKSLDLRKTYSRGSKPVLWMFWSDIGCARDAWRRSFTRIETTEDKLRVRIESERKMDACERVAREMLHVVNPFRYISSGNYEVGVSGKAWGWQCDERDGAEEGTRCSFAGEQVWGNGSSEAKSVIVTSVLFAKY